VYVSRREKGFNDFAEPEKVLEFYSDLNITGPFSLNEKLANIHHNSGSAGWNRPSCDIPAVKIPW